MGNWVGWTLDLARPNQSLENVIRMELAAHGQTVEEQEPDSFSDRHSKCEQLQVERIQP